MSNKTTILKREELYKKVWEIPMIQLAKEYGLSDVGLAKICKKMNIPKPSPGYWRKVETDHVVKKSPMPKIKEDENSEYQISLKNNNGDKDSLGSSLQNEIKELIEREKLSEYKIIVPEHVSH